jgi:hypothetical protein
MVGARPTVRRLETRTVPSVILFGPPTYDPTAANPFGVAVGDINGDGIPDIVTANSVGYGSGGTVSVLLGKGDGTFGPRTDYDVGDGALIPALADLNGDGRLDIVTANDYGRGMTVLLNNGDGTFARTDYAPGIGLVTSLAVGDLNGDGHPDIVLGDYSNSKVVVMLNNGDGTFKEFSDFSVPGAAVQSVKLGDLNHDGHLDLVVEYHGSSHVSVLLGNGDGTFGRPTNYAIQGPGAELALADMNGDGNLDIVASDAANAESVSVLLGNGDGTFAPRITTFTGATGGAQVAVGDFNGDGHLDLVTCNQQDQSLTVLLGNGDGTFGSRTDIADGNSPARVAVGDFNGDGRLDIVNTNHADNTVSVLNSLPPGLYISDASVTEGSGTTVTAVFAVTLVGGSSQTATVDYSTGDGTAKSPRDFVAASGTLTFSPGQTTQHIRVRVRDDGLEGGNQNFFVNLSNATNVPIVDSQGIGTIIDGTANPTISIADASVTEPATGTVRMAFTLTLSEASGLSVSVQFATENDTAEAPSDYTARSAVVSFKPGRTTRTIYITVKSDPSEGTNETFFVNLLNPINGTIGNSQAVGTINEPSV